MRVAAAMVVVVVLARFPLDPPPEMEKIINRTRQPERSLRMVPISLMSLVEEPPEERMVQIRYRDDEPLNPSILILKPYLDRQGPLLHLRLLAILHHRSARTFFLLVC
ncbi:hypothetical protein SAY87_006485 [Trapa incisa]|uniref:Uncharacterized protein n=2 Tax=Trapa TaxID=22665 RepID=A0AAN7L3N6_TRANT|nr:hypothetical protein SAY87_006485 [Trapa incisa]KAK4774355.1 hypothetical protein SAY86_009290 [Trapa natans]